MACRRPSMRRQWTRILLGAFLAASALPSSPGGPAVAAEPAKAGDEASNAKPEPARPYDAGNVPIQRVVDEIRCNLGKSKRVSGRFTIVQKTLVFCRNRRHLCANRVQPVSALTSGACDPGEPPEDLLPMPTKRLTELSVSRIAPPRQGRLELADQQFPGLSCRVTPDGVKSFALRYRIGGKQRRLTIGRYPIVGLAEARKRARAAQAMVERGIDPAAAKAEAEAEAAHNTVAAVVERYVAKRLQRTQTGPGIARMLRADVVAKWGDRRLEDISMRDVRELVETVAERAPVVGNRLLRYLRSLYGWAIANDIVVVDPTRGIERPHDEKPRHRALGDDEIRTVWQAFDAMAHPFGVLGKLLLLTGQRRGEWAGASWAEIDLVRAVWTLPAGRSKTGVAQMLPLVPEVLALLETIPRIAGTDLLFPSTRLGSGKPVSGFSKALRLAHKLSSTTGWHFHDLRRTCRTGFARLGITAAVGERILNHSDGTANRIAAIYDRHSYQPEMRRALELWAAEIERIVAGAEAKVVALRPASA